jgi:hypothetical protein
MKKVKVVKSMKKEQAVESKEQELAVESKEQELAALSDSATRKSTEDYAGQNLGWFGCPDIPQGEVVPISKEGLNRMIDDRRFIIAVQRTEQLQKMTEADVKAEVVRMYSALSLDKAGKEAAQLQSEWATAQNMLLKERQETLFEKKRAQLNELENVVYDVLFTKASSLVSQVKLLAKNQEFAELTSDNDLVSPVFRKTNSGYTLNTGTARICFEFGPVTAKARMAKTRLLSVPRTNSTPTTEYSYESQRIVVNGKEYKWKRTAARKLLKDNTISTKDAIPRLREAGYNVEE